MSIEIRKVGSRVVGWKVLLLADTECGKTTFGLSMPKSLVLDSEDGWAHYEDIAENTIGIVSTSSTKDVKEMFEMLEDGEDLLDEMQTLITDSKSNIYSGQQISAMEVEERRARSKKGEVDDQTVSQRGWGKIKLDTKRLQALTIDLASRGKFVVDMAQEVEIIKQVGDKRIVIGYKPDIHKTEKFVYDTIIRLSREKVGEEYTYKAEIYKDRTKVYKAGDIIEGGVSWENWKPYFDNKNKKGAKVVKTSYQDDVEKDEKVLENEDDTISLAIAAVKRVAKEKGKAELVPIFKGAKIKAIKDINSIEIAKTVLGLANEKLSE
jgi:hypothetical protein